MIIRSKTKVLFFKYEDVAFAEYETNEPRYVEITLKQGLKFRVYADDENFGRIMQALGFFT